MAVVKCYKENVYTEQGDKITPPILVTVNYWFVCMNVFCKFFLFLIFQTNCADIPESQNSKQLWVIVIGILIKCLGVETLWQLYWWIFDTISLPFWNMYLSQANLACVKSFVSDWGGTLFIVDEPQNYFCKVYQCVTCSLIYWCK